VQAEETKQRELRIRASAKSKGIDGDKAVKEAGPEPTEQELDEQAASRDSVFALRVLIDWITVMAFFKSQPIADSSQALEAPAVDASTGVASPSSATSAQPASGAGADAPLQPKPS